MALADDGWVAERATPVWETGVRQLDDACSPAASTALPHFRISVFGSARNSSGVGGVVSKPCSRSFALTAGSARTWCISAFNRSTMARGVPPAANSPYQVVAEYPGTADSITV